MKVIEKSSHTSWRSSRSNLRRGHCFTMGAARLLPANEYERKAAPGGPRGWKHSADNAKSPQSVVIVWVMMMMMEACYKSTITVMLQPVDAQGNTHKGQPVIRYDGVVEEKGRKSGIGTNDDRQSTLVLWDQPWLHLPSSHHLPSLQLVGCKVVNLPSRCH